MTESEWLAAVEPEPLFESIRNRHSNQDGALLAIRMANVFQRQVWDQFNPEERQRTAFLEQLLNDWTDTNEGEKLVRILPLILTGNFSEALSSAFSLSFPAWMVVRSMTIRSRELGLTAETQTEIIRDIVGNPFREVTFDPEWCSSAVVALTASITKGDHSHYPILADALLDAGCRDETVLDHCRQSGRHFKHCWVIEELLKPHANAVGNG